MAARLTHCIKYLPAHGVRSTTQLCSYFVPTSSPFQTEERFVLTHKRAHRSKQWSGAPHHHPRWFSSCPKVLLFPLQRSCISLSDPTSWFSLPTFTPNQKEVWMRKMRVLFGGEERMEDLLTCYLSGQKRDIYRKKLDTSQSVLWLACLCVCVWRWGQMYRRRDHLREFRELHEVIKQAAFTFFYCSFCPSSSIPNFCRFSPSQQASSLL